MSLITSAISDQKSRQVEHFDLLLISSPVSSKGDSIRRMERRFSQAVSVTKSLSTSIIHPQVTCFQKRTVSSKSNPITHNQHLLPLPSLPTLIHANSLPQARIRSHYARRNCGRQSESLRERPGYVAYIGMGGSKGRPEEDHGDRQAESGESGTPAIQGCALRHP